MEILRYYFCSYKKIYCDWSCIFVVGVERLEEIMEKEEDEQHVDENLNQVCHDKELNILKRIQITFVPRSDSVGSSISK